MMDRIIHGVIATLGIGATFMSQFDVAWVEPYRDALLWLGVTLCTAAQTGKLLPKKGPRPQGPA